MDEFFCAICVESSGMNDCALQGKQAQSKESNETNHFCCGNSTSPMHSNQFIQKNQNAFGVMMKSDLWDKGEKTVVGAVKLPAAKVENILTETEGDRGYTIEFVRTLKWFVQ